MVEIGWPHDEEIRDIIENQWAEWADLTYGRHSSLNDRFHDGDDVYWRVPGIASVVPEGYEGLHRFDSGTGRHDYNDHFQEHLNPGKYCRAPTCRDTNWGGYGRLHTRGSECPPYQRDPAPNEMAEFWESIREMARANGEAKREARS